jgi:hypothetical protein
MLDLEPNPAIVPQPLALGKSNSSVSSIPFGGLGGRTITDANPTENETSSRRDYHRSKGKERDTDLKIYVNDDDDNNRQEKSRSREEDLTPTSHSNS